MDPSSIPATPPDANADSSPAAPATADTPQSSQDQGVNAAPPAAEPTPPETPEPTLRDVLAQAIAPEKKTDTPEKPADPKAEKPADKPADKPDEKRPAAEDQAAADANLPFGKHPRWKQVIGENRELRQFRETASPRLQEYDRIVGFMHQNDIAPEEMQGLYVLGAMLKNDPAQALKTLREMIAPLEAFVGDKLPDDLALEVEEGSLPVERAREIARSRSESSFREEREKREGERAAQMQQHEMSVLLQTQANAVTAWEKQVASSDPDYPLMQELVVMELSRLQKASPARDVNGAIAHAESAYRTIKAKFRSAMQRDRTELPRGPSSRDTPASNGRQPAPTSMLDVVRQAL